jgi:hypothetical protein
MMTLDPRSDGRRAGLICVQGELGFRPPYPIILGTPLRTPAQASPGYPQDVQGLPNSYNGWYATQGTAYARTGYPMHPFMLSSSVIMDPGTRGDNGTARDQ